MLRHVLNSTFIALTALAVHSYYPYVHWPFLGLEAVDTVEHLEIVATVTKTGDETLKVLSDLHGPLNELPADTFVINASKGAQSSFTGIKLKYAPETAIGVEAYTTLIPGES